MNRAELDLLTWFAEDHRPINHFLAMSTEALSAWIRAHGGRTRHIDAAFYARMRLQSRMADRIGTAANILRLRR